jgi:hypothetical protein
MSKLKLNQLAKCLFTGVYLRVALCLILGLLKAPRTLLSSSCS